MSLEQWSKIIKESSDRRAQEHAEDTIEKDRIDGWKYVGETTVEGFKDRLTVWVYRNEYGIHLKRRFPNGNRQGEIESIPNERLRILLEAVSKLG